MIMIVSIFFFFLLLVCLFGTLRWINKELDKNKKERDTSLIILNSILSIFLFCLMYISLHICFSEIILKNKIYEIASWTNEQMTIYNKCSSDFKLLIPYLQTEKESDEYCFNKASGKKQRKDAIISEYLTILKGKSISVFKNCVRDKTLNIKLLKQTHSKIKQEILFKIGESCIKTIKPIE